VRERLSVDAGDLALWELQDPRLLSIPLLLRDKGVLGQASWQPVLRLRYRRDRFVDPFSGSRVSLDREISAAEVNTRFVSVSDRSPLAVAVLEVKGARERLPVALEPLLHLGMRKQSFSKFLAVYTHMTRRVL
jgi:hypothetical protein